MTEDRDLTVLFIALARHEVQRRAATSVSSRGDLVRMTERPNPGTVLGTRSGPICMINIYPYSPPPLPAPSSAPKRIYLLNGDDSDKIGMREA